MAYIYLYMYTWMDIATHKNQLEKSLDVLLAVEQTKAIRH